MESVNTNQNYRKNLVQNAFELMKSNYREYSKQSSFYLPKEIIKKQQKHNVKQ